MTKYFAGRLSIEAKTKGESCPGEYVCDTTPGARLWTFRTKESTEDTCRKCPLFPTKPGDESLELIPWINVATELDTMKDAGVTFAYPTTLDRREWACIRALAIARNKERQKDFLAQNDGATNAATYQRLLQQTGRTS